jgi:hypothetical protein
VHADPADIDTERAIKDALVELDRPLPERGSDAALLAAAVAMSEEALAGRLSARDLARWAHSTITHAGPALAQDLVLMDDVYDTLPYIDESKDEVDQRTLEAARRFAATAVR